MKILEALWDDFSFEQYVIGDLDAMSFSDLRSKADVPDSGNFNYHLEKLSGDLIDDRDDGYVLSPLGYNLMQSITTYEAFEYRSIPPTELDYDCPFCGNPLRMDYTRELVSTTCEHCDGLANGNISVVNLPVNEMSSTDVQRVIDAASLDLQHRIESVSYGRCWSCHADIDPTITICDDHTLDEDGTCPTCTVRFQAEIRVDCDHCGTAGAGPLLEAAIVDPRTTAFFAEHDAGPRNVGPFQYRLTCLETVTESVQTVDPPRVNYTFTYDGDTLNLDLQPKNGTITIQSK